MTNLARSRPARPVGSSDGARPPPLVAAWPGRRRRWFDGRELGGTSAGGPSSSGPLVATAGPSGAAGVVVRAGRHQFAAPSLGPYRARPISFAD
jgi:hypothetical protein